MKLTSTDRHYLKQRLLEERLGTSWILAKVEGLDLETRKKWQQKLCRIEQAQERLEGGCYGFCIDCSGPINRNRLYSLPYAERCRSCQRIFEQKQEDY